MTAHDYKEILKEINSLNRHPNTLRQIKRDMTGNTGLYRLAYHTNSDGSLSEMYISNWYGISMTTIKSLNDAIQFEKERMRGEHD